MQSWVRHFAVFALFAACGGGEHHSPADAATDTVATADAPWIAIDEDVAIDTGPVHGTSDNDLVIFRGIPYATALRWAPPTAPAVWTAPLDATAFGPACPQNNHPTLPQAEACLSINVWAHATGPARPVIVWVHGGGYVEGTARDPQYDAAALARRSGAVIVSFNYRLGVLGFLSLPQLAASDGGSGNWGLRDQIAALGWVKRNIAAFGGDPGRVLLAGESAGGASVCTLLAAPAAQGLYHAAAIQSGLCRLALAQTTQTGNFPAAQGVGVVVASQLGCTTGDVAACLRSKSVAQVLAVATGGATDVGFPVGGTLPVVDGVVLDQRPFAAIAAGRGAVPLITGANRDDASAFVATMVDDTPGSFSAYLTTVGQDANKTALQALYPVATLGERGAAIVYATDVAFACPSLQLAQSRSAPTYLYELERAVPNGPFAPYGAVHGFDYINLFATFSAWAITPSAADMSTSQTFQDAWGKLARGEAPWATSGHLAIDAMSNHVTTPWRGGRCAQLETLGILGN
jgi:para-nitrobenzyl esterase